MQRHIVTTRRMAILPSVDEVDDDHPPTQSLTAQPTLPLPPPPPQVDEDDDDPDFKRATATSHLGHRVSIVLVEIKPFSLSPPAQARSETIENEENELLESVDCELLLALNWEAEAVVVTEAYAGRSSAAVRASGRRLFVLVKLDTKQTGARILKWLRAQLLEHINKKRHNNKPNIVCVSTPAIDTLALVPWSMFRIHAVLKWSNMVRALLFLSERHMFRGQAAVDTADYAFYQEAAQWAATLVRQGELLRSDDPFFRAHEDFDHELILLFERTHYRHERMRAHARAAA